MSRQPYNPETEEVFSIKGDVQDGMVNASAGVNFAKAGAANPKIRYKGKHGNYVLEGDLFVDKQEMTLNIHCPKCHNVLRISSLRKHMDWDPNRGLSVEPYQCTWELGLTDGTVDRRMEFGLSLCRGTFAIDENQMKDA